MSQPLMATRSVQRCEEMPSTGLFGMRAKGGGGRDVDTDIHKVDKMDKMLTRH